MSNHVLVIDANRKPLIPCKPVTARRLLNAGKAAVFRQYPFTLILKKEVAEDPIQQCQIKLDPGSKTTGIVLLKGNQVIWGAELSHRGQQIKNALESRRSLRRSRRGRKNRYRQPRFLNRTRPKGWLAPSLAHRVETTLTWVNRLSRYCAIGSIAQELVRFDLQKMQNPEISGVEYQQGELAGYEVREYLLNKWSRKCVYCNADNLPLQIEHIHPRSKGGSNRVSNLTLACEPCNQRKGAQDIRDFLSTKPSLLTRILKQAKAPLKDAAAVNSTRWALFNRIKELGLTVSTGSGGQTKFNRSRLHLHKAHWLDAACVGDVDTLDISTTQPLLIKASGHGTRQMCRTDKYGFPKRYVPRFKFVRGFQTGDIVKADVPKGKKAGSHKGRVAVRSSGSFNISTAKGLVQGINAKYCTAIHRKDGYGYAF